MRPLRVQEWEVSDCSQPVGKYCRALGGLWGGWTSYTDAIIPPHLRSRASYRCQWIARPVRGAVPIPTPALQTHQRCVARGFQPWGRSQFRLCGTISIPDDGGVLGTPTVVSSSGASNPCGPMLLVPVMVVSSSSLSLSSLSSSLQCCFSRQVVASPTGTPEPELRSPRDMRCFELLCPVSD